MKPERWQQASRILESVLERAADQRAAYLDEVCAKDVDLRREVESLLVASERAGSLLESPAMEMAAPLFLDDSVESILGQSIGRYKIISTLGAGGMGDVYLAHDTRLDRNIALKLLPTHFTTDKDRLRRFEQEAHVASTLSHTNVCVIHEVGETENGHHYIAMEFVNGMTLRQHLAGARPTLTEVLDVAIQVASALAAAHAAGIVHRDIKPENIMVRSDGIIKVLDFGLAKLTEKPQTKDSEAATRVPVQTDTGMVMGTTAYMSPEQARGLPVDDRTDIWSLGVVLYEMLAGRPPFDGETPSDLIAAILRTDPPPVTFNGSEVPTELERVTRKALKKERDARYQTAGDLLNDLKDIKTELEFQAKLERSTPAEARDPVNAARGGGQANIETTQFGPFNADEDTKARKTSRAKYLVNQIRRYRLGAFVSLAILLSIVGTLAYGIYRFLAPDGRNPHFQKVKFTRLTTVANAIEAAVSPDGKFIAYIQRENGNYSLWTKAVATGNALQIVQDADGLGMAYLRFSPDGNYLYYSAEEKSGPDVLYQIPALGGTAKKMLAKGRTSARLPEGNINQPADDTRFRADTPITFSPDGKQFAFVSFATDPGGSQLVVVNTDGSGEGRILASRAVGEEFSGGGPAWSPDGKIIAIGVSTGTGATPQARVVGVAFDSGEVKTLSQQSWNGIGRLEWFRDGSGLMLLAKEKSEDKRQIWQLSYPSGEARCITNDLNSYASLSLTADFGALVTIQSQTSSNIWVAPKGNAGEARQLTSRRNADEGFFGVAWTPDGRVVYSSTAAINHSNLWIMNDDGSNPRQLTDSLADDTLPAVSPDGRYIVFTSNRSGKLNLWRMDMDGGNLKQLTNSVALEPDFSPDGRWVACIFLQSGKMTLWKVPVDGDSPVQLTETFANAPAVSSDGKLIAYFYYDEYAEKKTKVIIIPSDGGAPVKVLDYTPAAPPNVGLQWSPDDSSIIYQDGRQGGANLWRLPLNGSPATQLTDFKSEQIWNFYFMRDGRQLVCARGTTTSDVVMISESK
jgi:serine/threonine protein kinase/Tol biopolymer transport system component